MCDHAYIAQGRLLTLLSMFSTRSFFAQRVSFGVCLFFFFLKSFFFWSFGAWQSYQTGIHHKSAPSPELGQLLAAQSHSEAGEQSAGHQVKQGGLAHLHHGQSHEGDEQTHAVRWHEGGRHTRGDAVNIQNNIRAHLHPVYIPTVQAKK